MIFVNFRQKMIYRFFADVYQIGEGGSLMCAACPKSLIFATISLMLLFLIFKICDSHLHFSKFEPFKISCFQTVIDLACLFIDFVQLSVLIYYGVLKV